MKKINYDCIDIDIFLCDRFKDRLLGLMFKKNFNFGLQFNKCNSIHTFFMRENIDVILLDKNNYVIDIKKNLKPWRLFFFSFRVKNIIELPIGDYNLKIGDMVK